MPKDFFSAFTILPCIPLLRLILLLLPPRLIPPSPRVPSITLKMEAICFTFMYLIFTLLCILCVYTGSNSSFRPLPAHMHEQHPKRAHNAQITLLNLTQVWWWEPYSAATSVVQQPWLCLPWPYAFSPAVYWVSLG